MSHIAFISIPAHGHVNPVLGVIKELVRRGHSVTFYCYQTMAEKIIQSGADFIALDQWDSTPAPDETQKQKIGKDPAYSIGLITEMTLAIGPGLEQELQRKRPDLIVGDSMAFFAKLTARKLQIPYVCSTTTFAINKQTAAMMQEKGPGFLKIVKGLSSMQKNLKRLQQAGYQVRKVTDIVENEQSLPTLVYTSRFFQPMENSFPGNFYFAGPAVPAVKKNQADKGRPLVYISLGTVNNNDTSFLENCLKACKKANADAVVSTGDGVRAEQLKKIFPDFEICKSVNQLEVLSRADAFITHCGMNSISEAVLMDVPMLLYPVSSEQKANAKRLLELNAALIPQKTDENGLYEALMKTLQDKKSAEGRRKILNSFLQSGQAKGAADFIEKILKKNCA